MATKTVIFVRGEKVSSQRPWMFFHFHPVKDLHFASVDLVYFDFPNGKRKILKNWVPKRSRSGPAKFDEEVELLPIVKIRKEDMTLGKELPSILALYEWVKSQKAGSIVSLQIFSHGYFEGPIIWFDCFENSDEEDLSADRDIHDTEFRARDFFGTNPLAGSEGKKFAIAFRHNAFIKLWGCNRNDPLRSMVKNYVEAPNNAGGDSVRKSNLKTYLDAMMLSFQYQLASKLKLSSWVAPYGWGTNGYDREKLPGKKIRTVKYKGTFPPNLKIEHWWRASAYFREQPKYLRFYKNTLKSRIDATGYFEMSWFWIENIRKLIK